MEIIMPRGDLRTIQFGVSQNGLPYIDFDEIYFTVKKTVTNKTFVLQKKLSDGGITLEGNVFQFIIEPEDTEELEYGKYPFDICLVKEGVIKETSVGSLTLTSEVTFAENE